MKLNVEKFEPINQIDLVNFKDIRLVNDSYYILDCFNEFNNTSNNKLATLINFSHEALINTSNQIIELANSEGLHSHAKSIEIRLSNSSSND